MLTQSSIEWTDTTWNFVRGCQKVSPGCKFCYAETFAERFRGVKGSPYEQGFDLRLVPEKLGAPLRLSKPSTIFVNSMSDFFYEPVEVDYLEKACKVMAATPWHTYQVLTKRADRMRELLSTTLIEYAGFHHIWWGVSVEDKKYGLPRMDALQRTPVASRFLSIEPLLEDLGHVDFLNINWVIVGGESGAGCRPMDADWVRSLRDQCVYHDRPNIPFFFKQWGGHPKGKYGRELDGRTWDEMPEHIRGRAPVPAQKERARLEKEILG